MQHKNNAKSKSTNSNYHHSPKNQSQYYYDSLTSMGTNGLPHQPPSNIQMTKNGATPFLPRIAGASAFSNYSGHTGYTTSITTKVKHLK